MDVTRLYTVARSVLQAVGDYYDANGSDLNLPERRLVTPGLVAWDCEVCAVQVQTVGAFDGSPAESQSPHLEADPAYHLRSATIGITIARAVPLMEDGSAPDPADEERVARQVYADLGTCWNAITAAQDSDTLPGCGGVAFVSWATIGPEGGLTGSLLQIAVTLE